MAVQSSGYKKSVDFLRQLGLPTDQIEAYLYLLAHGPQTVLSLSRGLGTGRTKLYPLLDELAERQLITIHERHYGTSYEARDPSAVAFLVQERETDAQQLRTGLPVALQQLEALQYDSPATSKIIEYRGVDGLKQMNWNLSKATKEFRVLECAGLEKHLGSHFANKMRTLFDEKGLLSYDLTNRRKRLQEPGSEHVNAHIRYIDPKLFTIEFETYIYDNVVGLLSYDQTDIFGVEIHNDKLARQQRQLFDLLWQQAS